MTINTRIAELIKAFKDTESGFAKRLEVSTSVMFNIVNPKGRQSYPSGPVLEKILALELEGKRISAEWLMRGEGEMLQTSVNFQGPEEALTYLAQAIAELKLKSTEK